MIIVWDWRAVSCIKDKEKKIKKLTTFALFGWKFRFIKRLKVICEKFYFLSAENETNDKKNYGLVTHAYVHRLADMHLAGFAPAFTLSLCDSEYARYSATALSLGR